MSSDEILIDFVNRAINAGYTHVPIPQSLLAAASPSAIETVRQMCALCGVTIGVVAG